jgi:hypothetical protein
VCCDFAFTPQHIHRNDCTTQWSIKHTTSVKTLKGGPQLADRADMADHINKNAIDRYAPCLQALLLFERAIVNIGDFYYCVVLTVLFAIPNGVTCIYKILKNKLKC